MRGRSSPSSRTIVDLRTTAWTTADRAKPRISAQAICHVIDPVMDSACAIACIWSASPPCHGVNDPRAPALDNIYTYRGNLGNVPYPLAGAY